MAFRVRQLEKENESLKSQLADARAMIALMEERERSASLTSRSGADLSPSGSVASAATRTSTLTTSSKPPLAPSPRVDSPLSEDGKDSKVDDTDYSTCSNWCVPLYAVTRRVLRGLSPD